MKNSKLRRILLTLACAVLLVSLSVGATLAYLQDHTGVVTNTFTVGKVSFDDDDEGEAAVGLDEAPTDVYGEVVAGERRTFNEYKIIPGHNYVKDPTVHVGSDSEDAYLFVKVTSNLGELEAAADYEILEGENDLKAAEDQVGTIAQQMAALGWTAVDTEKEPGVYYYKDIVSANDDITVFKAFAIGGEVKMPNDEEVAQIKIMIDAYLIQEDGFENALDAWTEAQPDWQN